MFTAGICFILFIICNTMKPIVKAIALKESGNFRLAAGILYVAASVASLLLFIIFIAIACYEIWAMLTPQDWAFALAVLFGMVSTLPIYLAITKQPKRQQVWRVVDNTCEHLRGGQS